MSLKNPVTLLGIDPGTVRLVAQRLNHYATAGPVYVHMYVCMCVCVYMYMYIYIYIKYAGCAIYRRFCQVRFLPSLI